jgi:hypothetical protein
LSQLDSLRVVNAQNGNGGASGLRSADKDRAAPFEVSLPRLAPRVD